jgi:hypothetical protein
MRDFNSGLSSIILTSNGLEIADTALFPLATLQYLSEVQLPNTTMTLLDWISQKNMYTLRTGRPMLIRSVQGLETAGAGGVARAVFYRRDPQVIKMHIPMPHRFFPVWQRTPFTYDVPGIFRLGGVEVRRPGAMRYLDAFA